MKKGQNIVVIGAGIGGLTAAALLIKAGYEVTVLEAQVIPGGSAGTFFHKGYKFDAGATLAGGFTPGSPHTRVGEFLGLNWPIKPVDPAWVVQVGNERITQWTDPERWLEERQKKLPGSESFWLHQEKLAEISWRISSQSFPWPPVNLKNLLQLSMAFRPWLMPAVPYLFSPIASLFPGTITPLFKAFVDAQLLISAQTTSDHASALYGAAALDLPRRGVNQVLGGMGNIANTLAEWISSNGGKIFYRQKVEKIEIRDRKAIGLTTNKGLSLGFDGLLANLTPLGLSNLLGESIPNKLSREVKGQSLGWGAFVLYLGVREDVIQEIPGHFQLVMDPTMPLGEGNSVFISVSDPGDATRAPAGFRALTISTHTSVIEWWHLFNTDRDGYNTRKAAYVQKVLNAVEQIFPGIRSGINLILPGTPISYECFTHRPLGMVGGFPQNSLFQARGPQTGLQNVWLVGDSVFPGQSTAGVTLGGIRVVSEVIGRSKISI